MKRCWRKAGAGAAFGLYGVNPVYFTPTPAPETHEEERLVKMKMEALEHTSPDEPEDPEAYTLTLTTKMLVAWKNREEQGGWLRRARLVARQYKWSAFTDDACAPKSASVTEVAFTIHVDDRLESVCAGCEGCIPVGMEQPKDEKALVVTPHASIDFDGPCPVKEMLQGNGCMAFAKQPKNMAWRWTRCNPRL